jgi:hypothetical protein
MNIKWVYIINILKDTSYSTKVPINAQISTPFFPVKLLKFVGIKTRWVIQLYFRVVEDGVFRNVELS